MLNLKDDSWMMSPFPKDHLTVIFENAYFVKKCGGCANEFTAIIRKHHCRGCGKVFCGQCTRKKLLNKDKEPLRLCQCCETKRTNNQGVTPSNDKENVPYYGNALKLTFDLEEDDSMSKSSCNTSCSTPVITPVKQVSEEISCQPPVLLNSDNVTLRTPMSRKHLDMIHLAFTPPQSPNSPNAKSDKKGVLNFCCIFLALFCVGWLSTQLTSTTSKLMSEPTFLLEQNFLPLGAAFLEGKTDLQTMIDMQVQLVESHLAPVPTLLDEPEVTDTTSVDSTHSVSVSVVKKAERYSGFKYQLALWGGVRSVLRKIWQQISSVVGKVSGGLFNYLRGRRKAGTHTHSK